MAQTKDGKAIMQSILFTGRCCGCGADTMRAKNYEKVVVALCAWDTGLAISLEFCIPCSQNLHDTLDMELNKVKEANNEA